MNPEVLKQSQAPNQKCTKKNKKNSYKIPPSVELTVLMWHEDCGQTPRANVGEKSPEPQYEVLKYKLSSKVAARQEQTTKTVNGVVRGSPKLITAKGHNRYCGLVGGTLVEK